MLTPAASLIAAGTGRSLHLTTAETAFAAIASTTLVALLVPVVSARLQRRINEGTAGAEVRRRALERRTQQLNELYGPVLLLRNQCHYLARKLRESKTDPDAWHILDHVPEVLQDPIDGPIAHMIVAINTRIEELIVNKAGLLWGAGPPRSWILFLGHSRVLSIALSGGTAPALNEFSYFPPDFDSDLQQAYDALRADVDTLTNLETS